MGQLFLSKPDKAPGYSEYRRLGLQAVWHEGDYRLGIHLLGKGLLLTDFRREPNIHKRHEVLGFGRVIKADFPKLAKMRRQKNLADARTALLKVPRGSVNDPLLNDLRILDRDDEKDIQSLAKGVKRMWDYMQHMCNLRSPRYTEEAFAELESQFA